MLSLRLTLLLGLAAFAGDAPPPLRVLRITPSGDAGPTSTISVTFDRPVAGSLDRTIDPAAVFRIHPAVPGTIEWRDPITIRFTPARPLTANTTYAVTIDNSFEAMDGSRLEKPIQFSVRVRGPKVLSGAPVRAGNEPMFLEPNQKFELVVSAPAEPEAVAASVYLDFLATCRAADIVRLKAMGQRHITDRDPYDFREAGGWDRDRTADSLRRVVELVSENPLPKGCAGDLIVPEYLDELGRRGKLQRWRFHTYGAFRLVKAECPYQSCPTGPVHLRFSTPVRGSEVMRLVTIKPALPFTVRDSTEERHDWILEAELLPRKGYAVVVDPAIRDVFGQKLQGNPVSAFVTTGYQSKVEYGFGRYVVERSGLQTFAVKHVNVDTLYVNVAPVPDTLEAEFLSRAAWGWGDLWTRVQMGATQSRFPVSSERDRVKVYGVKLPAHNAQRPRSPTLLAVRISSPRVDPKAQEAAPISVVQVTDLGVHARIGVEEGVVWVTGVSDGKPRSGAAVTLYDQKGRAIADARTDGGGIARLGRFKRYAPADDQGDDDGGHWGFEGYVGVVLGNDRALVGINQYDPDLSPWQFNVPSAWGNQRNPAAGAVFTDRGIYRPGEPLYAKAIVRAGALGELRVPAGDSLRWLFRDREAGILKDTVAALSSFGTADHSIRIPGDAPLGYYTVTVQTKRAGSWTDLTSTSYRVAEYRPPEFLVDVNTDESPRFAGDSVRATVEARYLFGAPMARAAMTWSAREQSMYFWEIDIPDTDGYYLGESGWWWEDSGDRGPSVEVIASGVDTLDGTGNARLQVAVRQPPKGRPARFTIEATVTDVNRQTVSASTSVVAHPAEFYLGAKSKGKEYFWVAGQPQQVEIIAVKPDGARVPGVSVSGTLVRREWHQVRRERGGLSELVGEWVSDTVARCAATTSSSPATCDFTPNAGGTYVLIFWAKDARGREVSTSFYRWATGKGWVPWNDESQFKMDVIPDKTRYSVGDTATVLFASPFTDAEAWVTVEREGLIESRRLLLSSGSTALRFAITEAYAPNVYVSILVARGRSARPGPLDDPGRPTIRVGYAELSVTPEVKRLAVDLEPLQKEYRPGDTAQIRLQVRDARGRGAASEVTLWAVDEGVLALTGYRTPDPIDLIYQRRGLGLRLASNLVSVAPQIPEGEKGRRAPGGGGGQEAADVLRSRFQTTAFFLGSVVTNGEGRAVASAKLPDNLTTFRLMAVAVTAEDRYGGGQSSLLVTRPLLARPALPRFVRAGDRFRAGVVVNERAGGAPKVKVEAKAGGIRLDGKSSQTARLEPGRGKEVRFDFAATPGDTASFRFGVSSGRNADAVETRLPIRPSYHPRFYTVAGLLHDTATVEFTLPGDIDPDRSRLELNFGTSPLAVIRGARRIFRVYPYYCTEQVTSTVRPLIALYRAQQLLGEQLVAGDPKAEIQTAVAIISRRQNADGGIGYWRPSDWSTPWLSAYAGLALLEARQVGIPVSDSVLARLSRYFTTALHQETPIFSPVALWYTNIRPRLRDRVAAADFLSHMARPDLAVENELVRLAPQMAWEDRARLAQVLARRGERKASRELMAPIWSTVKVEGRRAISPKADRDDFYFSSHQRPVATLLLATLAVDSVHPLVGPLVETLVQQGRAQAGWIWNTQDYGFTVAALAEFTQRQRQSGERTLRVSAGGRQLFETRGRIGGRDSSTVLKGLLASGAEGSKALKLSLEAREPGAPVYYYLTVEEIPLQRPVTPDQDGIQVERWYEKFDGKTPVVSAVEGELVRVRLRITVPEERHFVVLDDALPAGLEAIDLSLRTVGGVSGPGTNMPDATEMMGRESDAEGDEGDHFEGGWYYGRWDAGWWSPFDHNELRDDRVIYAATVLWKGSYTATYLARATTPGVFVRPAAHAEEMYNPAVHGRSDGGVFTVTQRR